jgi:hypothetical protein
VRVLARATRRESVPTIRVLAVSPFCVFSRAVVVKPRWSTGPSAQTLPICFSGFAPPAVPLVRTATAWTDTVRTTSVRDVPVLLPNAPSHPAPLSPCRRATAANAPTMETPGIFPWCIACPNDMALRLSEGPLQEPLHKLSALGTEPLFKPPLPLRLATRTQWRRSEGVGVGVAEELGEALGVAASSVTIAAKPPLSRRHAKCASSLRALPTDNLASQWHASMACRFPPAAGWKKPTVTGVITHTRYISSQLQGVHYTV